MKLRKNIILKNKGFTLIELLAVIVILAIIALIATPIILNLIDNTKDSSVVRSGELYLDAVEQAIGRKNLNDNFNPSVCNIQEDGNLICEGIELKVETKGSRPSGGTITFDNGKLIKVKGMKLDSYELETNKQIKLVIKESLKPKGTYLSKGIVGEADVTFFNGTLKKNQIESIKIEDTKEVPEGVLGSWDASEAQDKSVMAWYTDVDNNGLYELYIGGEGGVKANPDSSYLFHHFSNLTSIDLKYLDTSNVTNMGSMFYRSYSLKELDLSSLDTSNVTNMNGMFSNYWYDGNSKLEKLDISNFNTSKVIDMRGMFSGCSALKELDLSSFNTSNVTDMSNMFSGCNNLISLNLNNFNTIKVTNMEGMFKECNSLVELNIDNFDTSNVISMSSMFVNCKILGKLDLSSFNTSNVTDMYVMFSGCQSLSKLDLSNFNTSKVTRMFGMFDNCRSITELDISNFVATSSVDTRNMFASCLNLEKLNISGLDMQNVNSLSGSFGSCSKLTTIYAKDEIAKSKINESLSNSKITGVNVIVAS